jgi:tetratricopeptide (TPR) repeat protein
LKVRGVIVRLLVVAFVLVAYFPQPGSAQDDHVSQARELLLEASALIKDIPQFQQESTIANTAGQQMRAGDLAHALATVHLLEKPEAEGLAMGSIAWQLVHSGNAAQALSLLQEAKESQGRDVSYEQVAQLLGEQCDFEQALRAAHLIKEPNRLGETLVRLAVLQAKAGDRANTSRVLAEALGVAEDASKKDPLHATIFSQIARAQADIGETPETLLALRRFTALAYSRKVETGDTSLLRELGATEAYLGDVSGAAQIIPELPNGSADLVYMSISQESAQRGSMGEAFAAASKISAPALRDSTLREIAILRRNHGSPNDPFEAIGKMNDPANRDEAIATLALEQAQSEDSAAYQTLQFWQATANDGAEDRGKSRETASVTYGLLGDFASAQRILSSIQEPEARQWPLWNLTRFLVNRGHTQEAVDLANHEQAAYPRIYALLGTAEGILDRVQSEAKAGTERH